MTCVRGACLVSVLVACLLSMVGVASGSKATAEQIIRIPIHVRSPAASGSFFNQFIKNQKKGFPFPGGRECEEDAHKLCPGVLKRCVGDFGCTTSCLTDHIPKLDGKCKKMHPCYLDVDKFCAHIPPGDNQMLQCLHKHKKELSKKCVAHHPCLEMSHPGKCPIIDHSGKAPSFIRNIQSFLKDLHHGSFFNPLSHLFNPAAARRHQHRHFQHMPFRVGNSMGTIRRHHMPPHHHHHSQAIHEVHAARKLVNRAQRLVEDEHRQLRKERAQMMAERRQLQREREDILRERAKQEALTELRHQQKRKKRKTKDRMNELHFREYDEDSDAPAAGARPLAWVMCLCLVLGVVGVGRT